MTHTLSIINLACIIRKHESSHVIKVLLVVLLSSLCPDALFVLPAHCWSFTERALIYAAAWLLTYCLYVQSWLIMKSFRRKEMNKLKSGGKYGVRFDSDEGFLLSWTRVILWFDELRRSAIWLKLSSTRRRVQKTKVILDCFKRKFNIIFHVANNEKWVKCDIISTISFVASKCTMSRVILFTEVLILFSHVH